MEELNEPTEFQKQILILNYDDFIVETNIEAIVRRNAGIFKPITKSQLQMLMRRYYNLRLNWRTWSCNVLRHLKFTKCECKRKTSFCDQETQTDFPSINSANPTHCNDLNMEQENMEKGQENDYEKEISTDADSGINKESYPMDESDNELTESHDEFWAENYMNDELNAGDENLSESARNFADLADNKDVQENMDNGDKGDSEKEESIVNDCGMIEEPFPMDESDKGSVEYHDEFRAEKHTSEELNVYNVNLSESSSDSDSSQADVESTESKEHLDTVPKNVFEWNDILYNNDRCVKMKPSIDIESILVEEWVRSYTSYKNKLRICHELFEEMPRRDCGSFCVILSGIDKHIPNKEIKFQFDMRSWTCVQMLLIAVRAICFGDLKVSKKFRSSEIYCGLATIFRATADFDYITIEYKEKLENDSVGYITAVYELNTYEAYSELSRSQFSPFEFNELCSFIEKSK